MEAQAAGLFSVACHGNAHRVLPVPSARYDGFARAAYAAPAALYALWRSPDTMLSVQVVGESGRRRALPADVFARSRRLSLSVVAIAAPPCASALFAHSSLRKAMTEHMPA